MTLFVERADGAVVCAADGTTTSITAWRGNPLREAMPAPAPGERGLAWSGTLADDPAAGSPLNWLRPGHDALAAWCRDIAPALAAGGATLCLQPHARHVLSDHPACLRFLDSVKELPIEIALAPATMLEPSMLGDVEDHLRRIFEALAPHTTLVVLHDVRPDGDALAPVPLGHGVLTPMLIERLVEHVAPQTPVVLLDADVERQVELLAAAAR